MFMDRGSTFQLVISAHCVTPAARKKKHIKKVNARTDFTCILVLWIIYQQWTDKWMKRISYSNINFRVLLSSLDQ